MLVAYGPGGQSVIAGETEPAQLLTWSHAQELRCPNCRSIVHVRGGLQRRTQLHFAHRKGECAWSSEAESPRHARGKLVLARWLMAQFPRAEVTLERRLPGPNRIADVFVTHASTVRWAVEFQCASLDREEWRQRHAAYRAAGILDIWIIGNNRRERQEAFIEAILTTAGEILFLDPLAPSSRCWLVWLVSRARLQSWQQEGARGPVIAARVGQPGYTATLDAQLPQLSLGEMGGIHYGPRTALEERSQLLQEMSRAAAIDEDALLKYLGRRLSSEEERGVLLPLLRAYRRDPALLRRYNYGRGRLSAADDQRILKAREWLEARSHGGSSTARLQEIARELPFVGPYAAFAGYMQMLIALV
jgi:Competence protein CoiA-like family